jgi:hypothetical protein
LNQDFLSALLPVNRHQDVFSLIFKSELIRVVIVITCWPFFFFFDSTCPAIAQKEMYTKHFRARPDDQCAEMNIFLRNKCNKFSTLFLSFQKQYDDGLHGYMDASAAAMYDPHSGHRPGLPGLPPHHSPHMNHAAAAGMHGYHGTPSHVSQATNHMGAVQPDKRDKEAIYG